jgi:glycosyltransferase involved in cell wall biosynthesis
MKIVIFINSLTLGGTEKAACHWARGLQERGHQVVVMTLADGPRRAELERYRVPLQVVKGSAPAIADALKELHPDVIHAHVENFMQASLKLLPKKIPAVLTNVFGRLPRPADAEWIDFELFISWTSCVQAARRAFRKLDADFFRRASVAVYPLDPMEPPPTAEIAAFRKQLGVTEDEVLFGRFSRPEPNKWTNLALDAFRLALRRNRKIKFLLREPPPLIAAELRTSPDADRFIILPATSDADELRRTISALDVVLHTSSIGESFGYGIAEPMNLGKPVITHSVPWGDQAQIELMRHGECGFVASTPTTMANAILKLAEGWDETPSSQLREQMGAAARQHIRALANPETSLARLEAIFRAAVEKRDNPFAAEDLQRAKTTANYLDAQQFGHSLAEQFALRPFYYRVRFHEFRKNFPQIKPLE